MSPRKFLLAGGGIAILLLAASLALVNLLESQGVPSAGRSDPSAPGGAPGPVAAGGLPGALAPGGVPAEPPPLVTEPTIGARPSAASTIAWDQVPVASRLGELGPALAAPVNSALAAARATIESCFEEDRQRRASRPAPVYTSDSAPTGPAVLVLQLESRTGALDVVEAQVESLGTSTRELADCACQVLRGWPINAPAATAGRRYRLKYSLL